MATRLPDAALLVALPITREDFGCRVAGSDWLAKFDIPSTTGPERELRLDAHWSSEYQPLVGQPLSELLDLARGLGAAVRTGATLGDLHTATSDHRIVILFAHWKGPEVVVDDLIGGRDPAVFAARARSSGTPLGDWLAGTLSAHGAIDLADALNDALTCALPDPRPQGTLIFQDPFSARTQRRDALDHMFAGLLRSGNRIELYDGLHSTDTVAEAIAPSFEGVLDLVTCHSSVLGTRLGGRSEHRFAIVQSPDALELSWAARCVRGALALAAGDGVEYLEARAAASQALAWAVSSMTLRGRREWHP